MANHKGSSLLMVICFTSTMSLMVLAVWRTTMYTVEAAQARMAYMQRLKSTEGLLNLAIELGIENYEQLIKNTNETAIEVPAWFTHQGKQYGGALSFNIQKDYLLVRALIKNEDAVGCAVRCHLSPGAEGGYQIAAWAIDAQV